MRGVRLEHLVRLMISLQIIVATTMLGVGEHSLVLPLITLVVVSVSAYVTDLTKLFHLKQWAADCAALCVVIISAAGAYQTDRPGLLVAVANLQCYLQYVLLFQPKTSRVYALLALLSLGQVAIASALVAGPMFGVLLLAYLLLGIAGFALLMLHAEASRFSRAAARRTSLGDRQLATGREPVLSGGVAPIDTRAVLRQLIVPVMQIGVMTVIAGSVLFFVLPRWNVANIEADSTEPLRMVGYSTTVLLGELGDVAYNPDLVMRIEFFRGRSTRQMKLDGEPLFRGTVLTRYEGRTWSHVPRKPYALPTDPKISTVRQRITAEPLDVGDLFCIFPVYAVDQPDPRLLVDRNSNRLMRRDEYRAHTLDFEVATTGITGNRQRDVIPCEFPIRTLELRALGMPPPVEQFPGLSELAASVVAARNIDPKLDRAGAARALSDYFRQSGEYFYSLEPQQRDDAIDPLEDFVTTHRAGHCEYFAGTLVLMLRSLNIPARMTIGFKGGEWNPLGMYYQVRQLHAHAWVEAYLQPDQIPAGAVSVGEAAHGAWLTLDPTDGIQEGNAAAQTTGVLARFYQSLDYARVLWINYVASLTSKRQRQGIYEPLAAGVEAAIDNLTSQEVWLARFEALEDSYVGEFWHWYRRHWFSWRGGLVAVGFSLVAVGAVWATRSLGRALRERGWLGKGKHLHRLPVLEMYRRLEAVLARAGLVRQPAQTAHEFAVAAGGELAERVEYRRVAHLPRQVVEGFYRVRFGGRALDNQEAEAVEHALAELELTLPRVARP